MVTINRNDGDDGGGGHGAPSALGHVSLLGQPSYGGCGAPYLGPSWLIFSANEYGLCWEYDSTLPFPARCVLVLTCDPFMDAFWWRISSWWNGLHVAHHVAH